MARRPPTAAAARVELIRVMDLLQTHITSALCQTVFRCVRTTERQRAWTLQALVRFWTAVILRAPEALSQALVETVDQREPMFPRIVATPEAFFQWPGSARPRLRRPGRRKSTHGSTRGDAGSSGVSAPGTPSAAARPAVLVALFYTSVVLALLATHAWDPRFFATVGPEWERHDPGLLKQADGSIYFAFATDPLGATRHHARFRTARVLYPLAAHALALGRANRIGWSLLLVNLAAIVLGTELMHRLLARRGLSPWLALVYGAWGGLGAVLLHGTAEALAYLCVLAGIEAQERGHPVLAGTGYLGGALSRETTLLLAVPYLLLSRRDRRGLSLVALAVLAAWVAWLGIVALVGTGAMIQPGAQPRFPLAGFLATRRFDLPVTLVYIIAPAVLVVGWATRELWRRPTDASLWAASLNALLVLQFPPPTAEMFWHSGRLATGFVAATLLAAPLAASAPRLWRALAILLATSVSWTIAVALRFLFWTVTPW